MSKAATAESACPICGEGPYTALLRHVGMSHSDDEKKRVLIEELQRLADELGRTPYVDEMQERGKYGSTTYEDNFGSWNEALDAAGLPPNRVRGVSKEVVLEELESLADELGRTPTQYDMVERGRFSVGTYIERFGSWNEAIDEVGLERNRTLRENPEPRPRDSKEYSDWRNAVFERDDYTCQDCGEVGGDITAHHIEYWSENEDRWYDVDNGITLCRQCHTHRHKGEYIHSAMKAERGRISYTKAARRESKQASKRRFA